MSQLCYNRGCGQRFDPENNTEGESGGGAGARCSPGGQCGQRGRLRALRGSASPWRCHPARGAPGTRVWGRGWPAAAKGSQGHRFLCCGPLWGLDSSQLPAAFCLLL